MQDHPVLGQVALGYSPMIDRQRNVVATRLTVFPERPDAAPDAAALLAALAEVWPADSAPSEPLKLQPRPLDPAAVAQRAATGGAGVKPPVSLNLAGEALLRGVMAAGPGPQLMVEVPAFMAGDASHHAALAALHGAGSVLLIKGRPLAPLPPEVLGWFSHSIVETDEERRGNAAPAPGVRTVTTVQAGARSSAEIEAAFQRGAVAVLGWPWDDAPPKPAGRNSVPSDVNVVMQLIQGVDREVPAAQLEAILRRDPTLAFRLMRYLNSPAFGLSVEINSFSHALMMLGYGRLKRWLALLLASSAKGANAKPVMFAAVRRGLLMEELSRSQGDAEMSGEMFICGVFSLLDRLLQQPFSELLASVPLPERVQQALRGDGGPYQPYLELVRAIELESVFDIREHAEALMLGAATVNRAVLTALHSARQLDG
jgi:EAL and modified HD-GYP domain-containing signal transduction protein